MRHPLVAAAVLAVLTVAAYHRAAQADFVWDDIPVILENTRVTQPQPVWSYWSDPTLIGGMDLRGFRPLTFASFRLNYLLSGPSRSAFHLTSVAIHLLAVFGVWRLSTVVLTWGHEASQEATFPVLVAGLFAVHPALSQAVVFLTARSTLIAAAGVLWAAVSYHAALKRMTAEEAERRQSGYGFFALAMACWCIGLSGKESAIAGAILFVGIEWWTHVRHQPASRFVGACTRLAVPATIGTVYLAWVFVAVQAQSTTPPARTLGENLIGQLGAAWEYATLLLWPIHLSIDHAAESLAAGWTWETTAGLCVVGILITVAFRTHKRIPGCAFGIAGALICIGPESYAVPLKILVNEHRLYLPAALLAVAITPFLARIRTTRMRTYAQGTLIAIVAIYVALTNLRLTDWRSAEQLWRSAWRTHPASCRAPAHLGKLALQASPPDVFQAAKLLEAATTCNPERLEPRILLVQALSLQEQHGKADVFAQALLADFPAESVVHSAYGTARARAGDLVAAQQAWTRALELDPGNLAARENLSKIQ